MASRVLWGYWVWAGLLMVVYLTVPQTAIVAAPAIALSATAAVVAGVRRHRPRRALPWLLYGGGILAFGTASFTAIVLSVIRHETAFPSLADAVFVGACFPMLLAGLLMLTRSGAATRDRTSTIDALILTVGAGFLSYTFLISPYLTNSALTGLQKAISSAYPLFDVLMLGILARIAVGGRRNISVVFLLLSGFVLLAADALYGLSQLNGDWAVGGPIDVGWLLFYVFGGASALHPSMVGLTEPKVVQTGPRGTRRTLVGAAVLGTASLVAPAVLFVESLRGPVVHGMIIAVASTLLVLLTAARVTFLAGTLRRSASRERELRLACEELLSAATAAAVDDVVRAAIGRLVPAGSSYRVLLTLGFVGSGNVEDALAMRYRHELPAEVADALGDFELALHCPLTVAGQRLGDLYVGAAEPVLISLQDAAPVLAGQAASVIRAIELNHEVNRRGVEEERLRRAYQDSLTGLGNRLAFQDAVARTVESGTRVGVIVLDIDDFKVVNEAVGHGIGDLLLVQVSRRLVQAVEPTGSVYRLADDEFGVVVAESRLDDVLDRAEAAFGEPFRLTGSVLSARASMGVATTETAADFQQLLSQADVALGEAKAAGKGRRQRFEASMHDKVLKRRQLRTDLDQALADDALQVYYQPIVELGTGRPRGLEALVRWPHPTRGMVPPLQFIDIAEESGLIVPLGAWVLRTSVRAATRWWQRDPAHAPYISVNVSVRQFRAHDFVDQVLRELADAGLPRHLLTLEITESLLLGDDEQITADIARLRETGIRISIDDFGTGYSSLSYLHRVSVDTLKLDKSFVDSIATSPRQLGLVRGIIQLAHTLEIDVVAEGIETEPDRKLLIDAQCGYGQGYLFARPMPEKDADAYLAAAAAPAAEVAELGTRNATIGGRRRA
ncbi:MAG TPA: EAL domain-containing protein [Actinoplanes sp.]